MPFPAADFDFFRKGESGVVHIVSILVLIGLVVQTLMVIGWWVQLEETGEGLRLAEQRIELLERRLSDLERPSRP